MKTQWIPTSEFYHEIIAAPDLPAKQALYRQHFIEPFRALMQMLAPMFQADLAQDDLAVARAWAWLIPGDLNNVPDVLQKLEAANAWQIAAEALAEGGARFDPYDERIGIDQIEGWLVLANPVNTIPNEDGYTGAIDFLSPRLFAQYSMPTPRAIERLPALVVHEMHHLVRQKACPWNIMTATVADYVVHEGLAESFARSLFGEAMVWDTITGYDPAQFETARQLIGAGLDKTGFDVIRGYIFGDEIAAKMNFQAVGMPLYGGYAVGYYVVQAYLERTGTSIEEATFQPADLIVRESGFFA